MLVRAAAASEPSDCQLRPDLFVAVEQREPFVTSTSDLGASIDRRLVEGVGKPRIVASRGSVAFCTASCRQANDFGFAGVAPFAGGLSSAQFSTNISMVAVFPRIISHAPPRGRVHPKRRRRRGRPHWPFMPATACLIRLRSAVKGIDRVPRPSPIRATDRIDRRSRKRSIVLRLAPVRRRTGCSAGRSRGRSAVRCCLLVRAVPLGCERIRTRRALHERCPVGGDHAARDAVDEYLEIRRQEIGHGTALIVHDGDVDGDDVDTGPESRWVLSGRRLAGGRPWSQQDAADKTPRLP